MDKNLNKTSKSKSNLIKNKLKVTSLKDGHFSKFLNTFNINCHKNFILGKNRMQRNKLQLLIEDNINNYKNELNKEYKNQNFLNRRNFKSPKFINYQFRLKSSHFKNLKLDKETITNQNILDYNYIYSPQILLKNSNNNIYTSNYDPNKISNKFINFNGIENFEKSDEITKFNNNNKEKNKKYKLKNKLNIKQREGYFGRKEKMGIPYLFDTYAIFCNNYSTKSEKSRHEIVLNDLQKLKGFLQGNPQSKISIFRDFLKKYKINIKEIPNENIMCLCDILCNNDNDILIHFLKPYLNMKDMILDLIHNLNSIKDFKTSTIENENNVKMRPINYNFDNKENIYLKEKSSSELINKMKDDLLFKTKVENNNNKDSRNEQKKINEKNNNNTKEFLSKTENSFYKKSRIASYQSPYFIPFKSHHILSPKIPSSTKKKFPELYDTNSLLKNINYQTKALGKRKEYSSNNDLLIKDMAKEIKELENDYYKVLNNNKNINKNKSATNFNSLKKTILSNSQKSFYNIKKDFKLNNKDFFNKTSIQFYNKKKNINENINKINLQIISLKNDKIDKLKKCMSNTEPSFKRKIDKKTDSLNEINIRMYYKPIKYKFGYKQIQDQSKITEMAALNFAKKKKFDPLGLICHF